MGLLKKLIERRRDRKDRDKIYKTLASDALRCGSSVGGKCMAAMKKCKKK